MIDPKLEGRTALVTGANNPEGIGAVTARALAEQGVRIFVTGRRGAYEPGGSTPPRPGPPVSVLVNNAARCAEDTFRAEILVGRIGEPRDVADAVVFLASEQARSITGQVLYVGGGHVMPT